MDVEGVCFDQAAQTHTATRTCYRKQRSEHDHSFMQRKPAVASATVFFFVFFLTFVSVGEASAVVFHKLRFHRKALSVLPYLLLIFPLFHNLLPIVPFFFILQHNVQTLQGFPGLM